MNALAAGQSYAIAVRFDKALKLIRSALTQWELGIAGEFDSTAVSNGDPEEEAERSRILLVDCPLLVFEALALDRASGVFFPLHVLVDADGDQTKVSMVNPTELFDVRLPLGAADPMERLQGRVALALESVRQRSGANNN
ncbi:MAG: DUF302 domain-containing protein [Acidobacteriia bacterium]|nr:DUF302 domain-containing protein [Terriglobia bacterium]